VEPAETIDSLSEFFLLLADLELSQRLIPLLHVSLDTLRRLLGNLNRVLKKRDGELIMRFS